MEYTNISDFIRTFVTSMGISVNSIEQVSTSQQVYNIATPDSKRLIGPHGDHLRALNHVIRRCTERIPALKDERFLVDVNGYQMVHIRDVEGKAKILAERVRTFRSTAELTPMNAYDRMIIHALFSGDPEIVTESEGTGPVRHVVLKYKG